MVGGGQEWSEQSWYSALIFEFATSYVHYWGRRAIDYAQKKGWQVVDLDGEAATADNFFSYLDTYHPDLILIATHGGPDKVIGQWDTPFLNSCDNDGKLNGTPTYYLACLAGQQLGKTTFEKGSPVVVAYLPEFIWNVNPSYTPDKDPLAAPFADVAVEPILAMIDGLSPKEVYARVMKKYDEVYNKWARDPSPDAAMVLTSLDNNRRGLIIYAGEGPITAPPSPILPALLALGGIGALALYLHHRSKMKKPKILPVGYGVG